MRLNNDDMQAIVRWMNSGATLDLPPKQKELFLRAQRAYQRLLEYKSDRVTLQHLKADYGAEYNESKCRRDLAAAKQLFGYRSPGSWEFTSGMVIDWTLERMAAAAKRADDKAYAALALVLHKFGHGDKAHDIDQEALANPVPREIVVNPELVGAKPDPQLEQKIMQLLGEKKAKGLDIPKFDAAEDADFEEVPS